MSAPRPAPVECPACRKKLQIPLSAAGKSVQCPECLEDVPVPKSVPAAVSVPVKPFDFSNGRPVPPAPEPAANAGDPFDFYSDGASAAADAVPSTPYFTVIEPRAWTLNRTYRIYVRAEKRQLVAMWAGIAADAAMVGVVRVEDPRKKKQKRQEDLEAQMLDEWEKVHPFNFAMWIKDIEDAHVVPPSFWFRLNHSTVPQIGLLKLSTSEGNWRLAASTVEDMRRMLELLPPLLGDRFESDLIWDKSRRRYRRG